MTRDLITGLVCLAASLAFLALTIGLPGPSLLVPIGPGFYPRILLGITAVLSAVLIAQALLARRKALARSSGEKSGKRPNYSLVLAAFGVFGVYVVLLPYLGFRISTLLFVAALQVVLAPPSGIRGWSSVLLIAFMTSAVTYFIFEHYLSVLLPRGRWTDF